MTLGRRLVIVVVTAVAVLSSLTGPVRAHGGEVVFSGTIDGFYIEVTDRVVPTQRGGEGLLYSVTLRNASTGLPVDGADVSVVASAGSTTVGPRAATYFGNQYQALIPDPGITNWDVRTTIRSDRGATSFEHQVAGAAPSQLANKAALALGIVGGAVLLAVWIRRRRRVPDSTLPTANTGD